MLSLQPFRVDQFEKMIDFDSFSVFKTRNIRVQKEIIETIISICNFIIAPKNLQH